MSNFDLVIAGGRLIDPEAKTEIIANVGITDGKIDAVTHDTLQGIAYIDGSGLVVGPGAIDMHSHGQDGENYRVQALDGVTTALELELGVENIFRWYQEREGKSLINFGASIGHIPVRMKVFNDPGQMLPLASAAYKSASKKEIEEMKGLMRLGFSEGALAMGFGLAYTPGASRWEPIEMFRVASEYEASCHVHMRGSGALDPLSSIDGLSELLAASLISGAPLHLVHINSSGHPVIPELFSMIEDAQAKGLDVTTECYPYTASMTAIDSAMFSGDWQSRQGLDYCDLEWVETGERLDARSFEEYRKIGGMVIKHFMDQDMVDMAVSSPLTAIASDGHLKNGKGHPRTAGTFSRIFGHYVRSGSISLTEAFRKTSLMPAQRLSHLSPAFKKKGRTTVGSDADLVIFDPKLIEDTATYSHPTLPSRGIKHVLVNGTFVVKDGDIQDGLFPGKGIRGRG